MERIRILLGSVATREGKGHCSQCFLYGETEAGRSSRHYSHRRCQRHARWPLEEACCSDPAFLGPLMWVPGQGVLLSERVVLSGRGVEG